MIVTCVQAAPPEFGRSSKNQLLMCEIIINVGQTHAHLHLNTAVKAIALGHCDDVLCV